MGVVKLCDLMHTKYIINSLSLEFKEVMNKCQQGTDTIDLAGCKFGPTCSVMMNDYYKTVDFINSEKPSWNNILQNNIKAARAEYESYEKLPIPASKPVKELLQWIKDVPTGSYEPVMGYSNVAQRALLVLLILARPDIELDIAKYATDVFEFVRDAWATSAKKHDKYWVLYSPDIVSMDLSSENIHDDSGAIISTSNFLKSHVVLPYEFGTERIVTFASQPDDEWKGVIDKCVRYIAQHDKKKEPTRKKGKTVRDFILTRRL